MIIPGPNPTETKSSFESWLNRCHKRRLRQKHPRFLYHATEQRFLSSIRENGLRVSEQGDLGRGVYFWSSRSALNTWIDEAEILEPAFFRIKFLSEAKHASQFFVSGEEPRVDWTRLDAMWIVQRDMLFQEIEQLSAPVQSRKETPLVTFRGRSLSVFAWAQELGMDQATLHRRIAVWGVEKAISTKPKAYNSTAGERSYTAKIDREIATMIREAYEQGDLTQKELSKEVGLDQSTISDIVNFKSWIPE